MSTTLFNAPYKKLTKSECENRFHREMATKIAHFNAAAVKQKEAIELIQKIDGVLGNKRTRLSQLNNEIELSSEAKMQKQALETLILNDEKKLEPYQIRLVKLNDNIARLEEEIVSLQAQERALAPSSSL